MDAHWDDDSFGGSVNELLQYLPTTIRPLSDLGVQHAVQELVLQYMWRTSRGERPTSSLNTLLRILNVHNQIDVTEQYNTIDLQFFFLWRDHQPDLPEPEVLQSRAPAVDRATREGWDILSCQWSPPETYVLPDSEAVEHEADIARALENPFPSPPPPSPSFPNLPPSSSSPPNYQSQGTRSVPNQSQTRDLSGPPLPYFTNPWQPQVAPPSSSFAPPGTDFGLLPTQPHYQSFPHPPPNTFHHPPPSSTIDWPPQPSAPFLFTPSNRGPGTMAQQQQSQHLAGPPPSASSHPAQTSTTSANKAMTTSTAATAATSTSTGTTGANTLLPPPPAAAPRAPRALRNTAPRLPNSIVPVTTELKNLIKDSDQWALECDMCGYARKQIREFNRHIRDGSGQRRLGFKVIACDPSQSMTWYGRDDMNREYSGRIVDHAVDGPFVVGLPCRNHIGGRR